MAFRTDARQRIRQITTYFSELWNDPFRHVQEASAEMDNHSRLIAFSRDLEEFVELLRDAQRYGPGSACDTTFRSLKAALESNYRDLRPFLIAYLRFDIEDERVGLLYSGKGTDAFEAIWAAPSIASFTESDDVFFADRVGRAKDALKYYNDHLQYLAEAA